MYFTSHPMVEALAVSAAAGLAAYLAGTVSRSGFVGGVLLGAVVYWSAGWAGFAVLGGFFVVASAVTKLGWRRKAALGMAQENRGRRGSKHALANCGTGLLLALVYKFTGGDSLAGAAFVAALATAAADTAATEVGSLYGRSAVLATTWRRVAPGTSGAISLTGTAASVFAALLISMLGWGVSLVSTARIAAAVFVAAFLGACLESLLGAIPRVERALGNEGLNFLNTLAGAAFCVILLKLTGLA